MRPWVLVLVCVACSDRVPSNPFDPANPSTGGRPLRLWAIPAESYVRLHWSVPQAQDLQAPILVRIREGCVDTVCTALPLQGTLVDPVWSLHPLRFVLEARVAGWSGTHRSDTATVLSSGGTCWLASGYDKIALLSPATQTLLPFVSIGAFVVDIVSSEGALWAAGSPGGVVCRIDADSSGPLLTDDMATGLAIRSLDVSASTGRVLLAHAHGLAWLDPARHALEHWATRVSAQPRVACAAPDEEGAWVWFSDQTLAYFPPGRADPLVRSHHGGVRAIVPVAGRSCWVGGDDGLALLSPQGMRRVCLSPVLDVESCSPHDCWVCTADGVVAHVNADGLTLDSRSVGAYLLSWSLHEQVLWVASPDGSLRKLTPELLDAARLLLPELPWAIVHGRA